MRYWQNWFVYLVVFCLAIDEYAVLVEAKKGGGAGGWLRNAGRRVLSNPKPNRNYGSRYPSSSRGGNFGLSSAGGYGRRTSGLGGGVGRSALTGALAGLAAGYVGAKVGRALAGGWHRGRYYHFGDRYYSGPGPNRIRCTIVTPDDFSMRYDDGRRVKEIIYECDRYREVCCADGCCERR